MSKSKSHNEEVAQKIEDLLNSQKAAMLPDVQYDEVKDLCVEAEELCRQGKIHDAHRIVKVVQNIIDEKWD
jgi:flagellin-specific chaperone FliS